MEGKGRSFHFCSGSEDGEIGRFLVKRCVPLRQEEMFYLMGTKWMDTPKHHHFLEGAISASTFSSNPSKTQV